MIKNIIIIVLLFLVVNTVDAQEKYWVSYKNKIATTFSLNNPEEFMSANALARRKKHSIKINQTDLPVCQTYLNTLNTLDVEILHSSKWLNGSMLLLEDVSTVHQIKALNFVKSIQKLTQNKTKSTQQKFNIKEDLVNAKSSEGNYGTAYNQIRMIGGAKLHDNNLRGEGIEIAVMDNGFPKVDVNRFYQKAFLDGRIKKGFDFVNNNDTLFDNGNGNHGNYVISTMVSDVEGEFIGTAPDATYYVYSTEDNFNEGLPEEYNWALASEMADDSMGVNAIITTSLGYSDGFDIPSTNHTYNDMDGNTTPITIAADLAASKGFLVINSAGNSGGNSWKYITAPSDGDSVLAIGAVDKDGVIVGFSSRGPSKDGRVKPNVCAQGFASQGINTSEKIVSINGTSFSCPITAGMAACLWQAFPDKSNMDIFYAIEKSAHLFSAPNDDYGFGIPNFHLAYLYLLNQKLPENEIVVFPNPVNDFFNFVIKSSDLDNNFEAKIIDINGKIVSSNNFEKNETLNIYVFEDAGLLQTGTYYFVIQSGKKLLKTKIIKN